MNPNELTIYDKEQEGRGMKMKSDLMPASTTVEYWKQLTDDNAHNRARIEISSWLSVQFDMGRNWQSFHEVIAMHKVFSAIETIAEDIGHMTQELMELRHTKTTAMLDLVRRHNPEAAKAILKAL